MRCEEYRTHDAYLAEDDPAVRRAAEEHLRGCAECRGWRSEYLEVMTVYASTVTEEPPQRRSRERHFRPSLLAAATLAAVALGLVILLRIDRAAVQPATTQSKHVVGWDELAPLALRSGLASLDQPKDEFDLRVERLRGAIAQIAAEVSADSF